MAKEEENQIIETVTEDGEKVQFELFDIIEFEEKEYALLLPVGDDAQDDEDEAELVLMRLLKEDDGYTFETIDDDDEFERVSAYIEDIEDED